MKITFTYANYPDLIDIPKYEKYEMALNLPDEIQHLIGIKERMVGIAEIVGQLTQCSLWITCKTLDLKEYLVVSRDVNDEILKDRDWYSRTIAFYYKGHIKGKSRFRHQVFQVLGTTFSNWPRVLHSRRGKNRKQKASLKYNLFPLNYIEQFDSKIFQSMYSLNSQLEFLLNTKPESSWMLQGVNPTWTDYKLREKYIKKFDTWNKSQDKNKTKRGKGKTGNTRRYGAIPGVFQGVQFRSQLEIRLATELTSRGIDWIYEKERLGQGNYLVDFYLPNHKIWIEVKGRFEARDHYLLKDVAEVLENERKEKLFVFTSGKCFHVTRISFEPLKKSQLWNIIEQSQTNWNN